MVRMNSRVIQYGVDIPLFYPTRQDFKWGFFFSVEAKGKSKGSGKLSRIFKPQGSTAPRIFSWNCWGFKFRVLMELNIWPWGLRTWVLEATRFCRSFSVEKVFLLPLEKVGGSRISRSNFSSLFLAFFKNSFTSIT